MALPANISTGRVTGQFIIGVADGADEDDEPDFIAARGTIAFTASTPYLPNPTASPNPVTMLKTTILAVLDGEGYICTPDPVDPTMAGRRGIRLVATDDPDASVEGWTWKATPQFLNVNGTVIHDAIKTFDFALPSGATVDLTTVVKVPASQGIGTEQAEALAAAAQAAAAQTAEDLKAVKDAGLANDTGVAGFLTSGAKTSVALKNAIDVKVADEGLVAVDENFDFPAPVAARQAERLGDATTAEGAVLAATISDKTDRQGVAVSGAPLAILRARLAKRQTEPVAIVFLGSSTTAGNGASTPANRYPNQLMQFIQGAYPSGGLETDTQASPLGEFAHILAPGVHGYNAGYSGRTTADYNPEWKAARLAALRPAVVFHMIGSNDMSSGMSPATYKTNLEWQLDYFDRAATMPYVNVLVHSYRRLDVPNPAHPWEAYREVLIELASERSNVAFVDYSGAFAEVGVPGTNPLNLIGPDNVHATDAGYAFAADCMRAALDLPRLSAPRVPEVPNPTFTSDAFNGDGPLAGRNSDAALGGSPTPWQGETNAFSTDGGSLVRTTTGATAGVSLSLPSPDVEVSMKLSVIPGATDSVFMDVRRTTAGSATSPDAIRIQVAAGGAVTLRERVGGVSTLLVTGVTCAVGDKLAMRVVGDQVRLIQNDIQVGAVATTKVRGQGYAGFGLAAGGSLSVSEFIIRRITDSTAP